eukprot:scaffold94682_cov16-Prasinocladus_malaysianus.AAC.1
MVAEDRARRQRLGPATAIIANFHHPHGCGRDSQRMEFILHGRARQPLSHSHQHIVNKMPPVLCGNRGMATPSAHPNVARDTDREAEMWQAGNKMEQRKL